jgi:F-type H+-transporting ATPase subunit b
MAGGIDATLIAATGFATFIGGLIYLKVPAMITKGLDDQAAKIAAELAEAKRLREEAEALRKSYEDQRQEVEASAQAIIAKAHEDAERLKVEAEAQLATSIATRTRQAEERIKRAEEAAIGDVRAAATNAAIATAEKILVSSGRGKSGEKLVSASIASLSGQFGS